MRFTFVAEQRVASAMSASASFAPLRSAPVRSASEKLLSSVDSRQAFHFATPSFNFSKCSSFAMPHGTRPQPPSHAENTEDRLASLVRAKHYSAMPADELRPTITWNGVAIFSPSASSSAALRSATETSATDCRSPQPSANGRKSIIPQGLYRHSIAAPACRASCQIGRSHQDRCSCQRRLGPALFRHAR